MQKTYISLDIETTGFDPSSDDIIEIGAVKFRGDEILETFHTLVNPHRPLPYRIQILTGITPDEVDIAPPLSVVLGNLISFIGDYPIIGQSISFDLSFLCQNGASLPNRAYDTYEFATILLPTLSDYSLTNLCRELGIPYPVHHRALADAMAAKDVFLALLGKAYQLDGPIIAEIDRLTRGIDWPLAYLFRHIAEERLGGVFSQVGELPFEVISKGGKGEKMAPAPRRKLLNLERLTWMLGDDGPLARAFPGFEHRPEQVEMLPAVAVALNQSEHLIVEAGTGTGKSVAYLLPAIIFAVENSVTVVISTNTINLQEQLMGKDIPHLIKALEGESLPPPRYTQLKGRNNYLCLRRWAWLRRNLPLSVDEVRFLVRTLVWAAKTQTGDRAELGLSGEPLWSRVCAQAESCLSVKCPYQQRGCCFRYRVRQKAEGAHLIIVNHALLLSEIARSGNVLPEYSHLIIDEAHHLEEEATQQWGFQVGEYDLAGYLNRLSQRVEKDRYTGLLFELGNHFRGSSVPLSSQRDIEELAQSLHNLVEHCQDRVLELFDALWHFLESHAEEQGEYERRLRLTATVRGLPGWKRVELAWDNLSLALANIESGISRLYAMMEPFSDAKVLDYEGLMIELSSLLYRSYELKQQIGLVLSGQEDENIYWVSLRDRRNILTLCAAPLNVGQLLGKSLFSQKECVVLTSATLSTEGNFEYIKERLALEEADELLLGSSFDYMNSAMVYVPEDIPEPGQPGYQQAVEQALIDLCRATQGKTLALFTSHAALRASYEALRNPLREKDILVLGQGIDGTPRQLLQTFKANPRTVLLGTSSLWEGIDVVGETLSVLVMARLPFTVPNDPVFAARSELFDDPFNQYAIPQAVLRFKQGFGRLIRSRSDRGVMVVLDRRIKSKPYGTAFFGSLPPCAVKSGRMRHLTHEVVAWLEGALDRQI